MSGDKLTFEVSTLEKSASLINDAVNMCSDALLQLDGAWLPFNALGSAGEELRAGGDGYEETRRDAMNRVSGTMNRLIGFREALQTVANRYAGVEEENTKEAKKAPGLRHRPDI